MAHLDKDDSPTMARVLSIAANVSCQWDLYLANTYSLKQLQALDFADVRLPLDWFDAWREQA